MTAPHPIIAFVCASCKVKQATLLGHQPGKKLTSLRQITMYLLHVYGGLHYQTIARMFDRPSATIPRECKRVKASEKLMWRCAKYALEMNEDGIEWHAETKVKP